MMTKIKNELKAVIMNKNSFLEECIEIISEADRDSILMLGTEIRIIFNRKEILGHIDIKNIFFGFKQVIKVYIDVDRGDDILLKTIYLKRKEYLFVKAAIKHRIDILNYIDFYKIFHETALDNE